ncbi:MAG: hypothetical protein CUN52_08840 [Phototrophicales bacterium]|nr:MAG: hypothetical protein CUN52_08840 [Phototrophicales bacterium]
MRQIGTLIVILFIIISLGIVGWGYIQRNQPQPKAPQPIPIELTVVANPMAHAWITQAVAQFNQSDLSKIDQFVIRISVNPTPADDMTVWRATWNDANRPDMWLASSSLSVQYRGYPLLVEDSLTVALSPMIWVASVPAYNAITRNGELKLDWDTVQAVASAGTWANFGTNNPQGNVNIAFAPPDSSMNGLMVLYGAESYYIRSLNLDGVSTSQDFLTWLAPIVDSVPNFNTIGADVATFMLTRGASIHIALMPEAQLLTQIDTFLRTRPVMVSYPEYPMVFDFQLAWTTEDGDTTAQQARLRAIQTFGQWLLEPAQQGQLSQYGLRPITTPISQNDELFRKGADVGIVYEPLFDPYLLQANLNKGTNLLAWFARHRVR